MMSNDNIMDISPVSYTNKDFRAIYEELISLVLDLTARWDPTSTNESDPGLVLLKLKAFLADKLNYNIDKNTLENFPSQATQRGNAQKLYDILGYNMGYYKSATTDIIMRYRPTSEVKFTGEAYTIPAFTQLTDDSNRVNYVTTQAATITTVLGNQSNSNLEIPIIEGVVLDFLINGNSKITVDNLDSDYRLYFNESMIASNGIYVYNIATPTRFWDSVSNLESTQLGQSVFKFGVLPTTNVCYLEFPQDAATLFKDGIGIKYIITTGVEGNISANVLTSLTNDLTIEDVNIKGCTLIVQPSSAANGENPESLKDAYKNCKKTIDTFNTLVTTLDYANALYRVTNNIYDQNIKSYGNVVSNVVVGDRTDDVNYSYKVVNKTLDGDRIIPLVDIESSTDDGKPEKYFLNAFNVSVYALNSSNSVESKDSYNYTFQTSATTLYDAQEAIKDYKSILHDYIDTIGSGTSYPKSFIFKNLAKLEGKVYTYQKVTTAESKEILKNINTALYKNFNARKVEFGKELNYDDLISVIEKSDDRIKNIILDYPEYFVKRMMSDNSLKPLNKIIYETYNPTNESYDKNIRLTLTSLDELDILAKSILAGVTPYMIFDDALVLDYTMEPAKNGSECLTINESTFPSNNEIKLNRGIAAITTETEISSESELRKNENVFCVGPSYVSKAQLSTCLYYKFITNKEFVDENNGGLPIYHRYTYYKLKSNDKGTLIKDFSITKEEYDTGIKGEDKIYYKKEDEIISFSEYNTLVNILEENNAAADSKVTKGITYHLVIPANSYYEMGDGEALYVSESKNEDGSLVLTGDSKNYWIYYGSDKELNIIHPTMNIIGEYRSTLPNNLNNDKVAGSTAENLGTNNQIEILGENSVQINKNNKPIYAVWSIDNLYNQLFNNIIATDNTENNYYEYKYLLQNNDIFIYTDEKKQSLVLLGSGTEISIRMKYSDDKHKDATLANLTNNFLYYKDKPWSMKKLDISSINANGLNANIEWNKIPTGVELYVAEKQIITLGEGTTIKFTGAGDITNTPIEVSSFEYKYKDENLYNNLPQLLGGATDKKWSVFSRLQLAISPTEGQKLEEGQRVILYLAQMKADEENIVENYGKWQLSTEDSSPSTSSSYWELINTPYIDYDAGTTYKKDDIVKKDGDYYKCKSNNVKGKDPTLPQYLRYWELIPDYDTAIIYIKNDYVKHGDDLYKCKKTMEGLFDENASYAEISNQYITANSIVALTGGDKLNSAVMTSDGEFENTLQLYISGKTADIVENAIKFTSIALTNTSYWEKLSSAPDPSSYTDYDSSKNYKANDIVKKDDDYYKCIKDTNINAIESKNYSISTDNENGYTQIKLTAGRTDDEDGLIGTFSLTLSPRFLNTLIPILYTSNDEITSSTDVGYLELVGEANGDAPVVLEDINKSDTDTNSSSILINGYLNKYINYYRFTSANESVVKYLNLKLNVKGLRVNQTITIYNPIKIKSENPILDCYFENTSGESTSVKERVKLLATRYVDLEGKLRDLFNYGYRINEENLIEDPLNAESFFNSNHIFNKYTIPQLDTNNINISVANQSLQSYSRR